MIIPKQSYMQPIKEWVDLMLETAKGRGWLFDTKLRQYFLPALLFFGLFVVLYAEYQVYQFNQKRVLSTLVSD